MYKHFYDNQYLSGLRLNARILFLNREREREKGREERDYISVLELFELM